MEANKEFVIIGNQNAITYKELFPLLMNNRIWLGATGFSSDMVFGVPEGTVVKESDKKKAERLGYVGNYTRLGNSCWFTNIDHGRRHQPLRLMTEAENIRFSKHKEIKGRGYTKYDNYDAIEVNYYDAIPSDYDGIMGVSVTYLDKYCPEQFEIVGITKTWYGMANKVYPKQTQVDKKGKKSEVTKLNDGAVIEIDGPLEDETYYIVDGKYYKQMYARVLIRKRK